MSEHLTRRDLLAYVDGELSHWRTRRTRQHLLSCWNCRRELERLEQDIGAIVDAQTQAFLPSVLPPERPWQNFDELAASPPALRRGLTAPYWLHPLAQMPTRPLSWAVALVAVSLVAILYLWVIPERLSASGILQKAALADRQRATAQPRRILRQRVAVERTDRRSRARTTASIESWKSGNRAVWRGNSADLRRHYEENGLAAALPLSAPSWEEWLHNTANSVELNSDSGAMELRSHATQPNAAIEAVTLRIAPQTWRVEAMQLTFPDAIFDLRETDFAAVEASEASEEVLTALNLRQPAAESTSPVPTHTSHAEAGVPRGPETAELQMSIEFRLHQIGADLSDPIELTRTSDGRVTIRAAGVSPERRQQLAGIFGADPNIDLQLEQPAASAPEGSAPVFANRLDARSGPDQELVQFFGGVEAAEKTAQAVLRADSAVLARLYALQRLAEHWPVSQESSLSPESRTRLRAMIDDHSRALNSALPELDRLIAPLLQRFCAPASSATVPSSWRDSSAAGLSAARTLDRLLRATLTASSSSTPIATACPDLASANATLEAAAASLRTLL